MKRFKSIVLAVVALVVVVSLGAPSPASAQSSASLSIVPKKNYIVDPGETIKDKLLIRNVDSNQDLQLNLRVIDFTYTDDGGTPKLMLDEDSQPTTWSLRPYLKIPRSTQINAGGNKSLDISVTLPEGLGAGSYYSAIIYSTGAPDGGNVGLSASGVTLVFVTVPGKVNEDLTLKKIGSYDIEKSKFSYINMNEPRAIAYTVENKGNVTEAPAGTIKLRNWFGQEYNINDVNPNGSLALIGQTRTFTACIKLKTTEVNLRNNAAATANSCDSAGLWPGLYFTSAELYYGQNGNLTKELRGSGHFWYLPLWFLIALSIILLIVAFYIWRIVVYVRGGSFKLGGTPRGASRRRSSRRR